MFKYLNGRTQFSPNDLFRYMPYGFNETRRMESSSDVVFQLKKNILSTYNLPEVMAELPQENGSDELYGLFVFAYEIYNGDIHDLLEFPAKKNR